MDRESNILAHVRGIVASYANGGECDQSKRLVFADYLDDVGQDDSAAKERWLAENGKWPASSEPSGILGGWYPAAPYSPKCPESCILPDNFFSKAGLASTRGIDEHDFIQAELMIIGMEHLQK